MAYVYDDTGERVIKTSPQGETAYVNQFYVVRNRAVATKHVFAGGSRLVSQLAGQPDENGVITTPTAGNSGQVPWGWSNGNGNGGNNGNAGGNSGNNAGGAVFENDQYFYHPDHLGSSSYVTDIDGEIFQHVEYFPFGETFFQESSNTQRTPYLFTGKELDEETGLYYFGARYYDPRTSVWQSADPILASYMAGKGSGGGIFAPVNLNLYGYVQQRPIVMRDPNGKQTITIELSLIAADIGAQVGQNLRDMPTQAEYYDGTPNHVPFPYETVGVAMKAISLGTASIVLMADNKTVLHILGHDGFGNDFTGNIKFVDAETGLLEWVFAVNGGLITDPVNMGTNNRVTPDDAIGHGIQDVMTWVMWGTSAIDPSTPTERFAALISMGYFGYSGDVNMTKQERAAFQTEMMNQAYGSLNWVYQNEHGGIVTFYSSEMD